MVSGISKSTDKGDGTADRRDSLGGVSLLSPLTPAELVQAERLASFRRFRAGEEILSRDSDTKDIFFVLSGAVRVVNYSSTGREIAYATVGSGEYFGELAAIDGGPRSASVIGLEAGQVASLTPEAFLSLLHRHPEIAIAIIGRMAKIIRGSNDRILDLATLGAHQRVFRELVKLAKPDPVRTGAWLIYPIPRQVEIAAQASTTRETVARVLGGLAGNGIVERKSKTLYIRDLARLKALADGTAQNGGLI